MTATTAVTNVPVVSEAVALRRPKPLRMLWVTAVWGACFVAIELGLRDAPVLWFAALRAVMAGLALLVVAGAQHRPAPSGVRAWGLITVLGLVNVTVGFAAMFGGVFCVVRAVRDSVSAGGCLISQLEILPALGFCNDPPRTIWCRPRPTLTAPTTPAHLASFILILDGPWRVTKRPPARRPDHKPATCSGSGQPAGHPRTAGRARRTPRCDGSERMLVTFVRSGVDVERVGLLDGPREQSDR